MFSLRTLIVKQTTSNKMSCARANKCRAPPQLHARTRERGRELKGGSREITAFSIFVFVSLSLRRQQWGTPLRALRHFRGGKKARFLLFFCGSEGKE